MASVIAGGLLAVRAGGIARPSTAQNLKAASTRPRTNNRTCRWNSNGAMGAQASSDVDDLKLSDGCRGAPLQPGMKLPIPGTEAMMASRVNLSLKLSRPPESVPPHLEHSEVNVGSVSRARRRTVQPISPCRRSCAGTVTARLPVRALWRTGHCYHSIRCSDTSISLR